MSDTKQLHKLRTVRKFAQDSAKRKKQVYYLHDVAIDDAGAGQQHVRDLLHAEDLRQVAAAEKRWRKR
jgi:hypothetical protein